MKKIMNLVLLAVLLTSCNEPTQRQVEEDIDTKMEKEFNALTPPVMLMAKDTACSFNTVSVTVIDATGKTLTLGNLLTLANTIGHSRNVGDTLRK